MNYKSEYKNQKEFEKKILTASIEELQEYIDMGASPCKNKGKAILNSVERNDKKIFIFMFQNISHRKTQIDYSELIYLLLKKESFNLLEMLIKNAINIEFDFYLEKNKYIDSAFKKLADENNLDLKKINFIFTLLSSHNNLNDTVKEKILLTLINENEIELFKNKFNKLTKYNFLLKREILDYLIENKKEEFMHLLIEDEEDIKSIIQKIEESLIGGIQNVLLKFKNNKGITLKEINQIEPLVLLAAKSENYTLTKRFYNRKITQEKEKNLLFIELHQIGNKKFQEKILNLFSNDKDFDINKVKNDALYRASISKNKTIINYILNNSNEENFKENVMSYVVYENELFELFLNEPRIKLETPDLYSISNCILFEEYEKIKILMENDINIKNYITLEYILKQYKNKKYKALEVILPYKNLNDYKNEIEDPELIKFWKINSF